MAWIDQNLNQSRVQIGNEELLFGPFSMGTNWTKVRIGMRYSLAAGATPATMSLYGAQTVPLLFFGICAGKKGWTHASPDMVIVAWPADLTPVVSGVSYYGISGNVYYYSYRSGSLGARIFGQDSSMALLPKSPVRACMFMDIIKPYDVSSTSLAINFYTPNTALISTDQTTSSFIEALQSDAALSSYSAPAPTASAFNLTLAQLNSLDTICVGWGRCVPVLQIFNVGAARLL